MQQFTAAKQVLPYLPALYGRKNMAELRRYSEVLSKFRQYFGHSSAYLCSSSGRVEFIGNHLDHNGGKVIACTVNLDVIAAFCANGTNTINIAGKNRSMLRIHTEDVALTGRSVGLVKGVVRYLKEHGYNIGGFDAYTHSVIPAGAGVSSSAAFELAIGSIISALFNNGAIPADVLARAGQYAENAYFNKPCGLLDQSAIAVGGTVLLNFANGLTYTPLQWQPNSVALVLINSGASHSGLTDLYAQIPADMQAVARHFGKQRLVDVDSNQFFACYNAVAAQVGQRQALRAKHFFEENARVGQMAALLNGAEATASEAEVASRLIALINDSGNSSLLQLKNCAVDDSDTAIADIIRFARGVCPCGARVHGGGFAGTVLCVLPAAYLSRFVQQATARYGVDRVLPLRLRSLGTTVL